MMNLRHIFLMICLTVAIDANAKNKPNSNKNKYAKESSQSFDLSKASFKEILNRYVFIADFNPKDAERPISKEAFWKYPFKLAPVKFQLDIEDVDLKSMVFQIKGAGPVAEAFNIGRVAFLEGDYMRAHEVWLDGRQKFKDDVHVNKRFEFFMGVNAISAYLKKIKSQNVDPGDVELKAFLQRTAYFFASAYILRRDVADEQIEFYAPWALYNLAVIYYKFDRIPSVYGAATEGLGRLLKQGKTLHRSEFHQLVAEALIRNQDLIGAIQELDTAIRQDPNPIQAARMFNRAADIYYDLNNYELAEDLYAMAAAIDRERATYSPEQALLRAESIFWLGRFEESGQMFKTAVDAAFKTSGHDWLTENQTIPWAWLRVGDALLARSVSSNKKSEMLDQARLAYFKVQTEFPKSPAARIADVRGACMELPTYQGNNVKHARELLEDVKSKNDVPAVLMELVWACDAASYSEREHTDNMVQKIKEFSDKYPNSRFLSAMIGPVREVQASKIEDYFVKKDWENATDFFEQKQKTLFPHVSDDLALNLWRAYVATSRSKDAVAYWRKSQWTHLETDTELLRAAAFLYEATADQKNNALNQERLKIDKLFLKKKWDKSPSQEEISYLGRVLQSKGAASAYGWILKLQDQWTAGDEGALCSQKLPFMSRITNDAKSDAATLADVYRRAKGVDSKTIFALKEKDKTCFQSWLDFEAKVLDAKDKEVQYATRSEWPIDGSWMDRLWMWSEELNALGKRDDARKIWQTIAEKAPKESFEYKMSKTRLDPLKTEFESLWK